VKLLLALAVWASGLPVLAQSTSMAEAEARRLGLATQVGNWHLVRYSSGESAHFLYTQEKRAFSVYITKLNGSSDLKERPGWRVTALSRGRRGYLHQDGRSPERNALVWQQGQQRWMILGRLSAQELVQLAKKL